jgi:hypothetical protein
MKILSTEIGYFGLANGSSKESRHLYQQFPAPTVAASK